MLSFYKRKKLIKSLNTLTSAVLNHRISQMLKSITFNKNKVTIIFEIPNKTKHEVENFESEIINITNLCGYNKEQVSLIISSKLKKDQSSQIKELKNIKNIICVASCKGGVGKSTIAINIAYDYAAKGLKVGILDGDIYGPSVPIMMNIKNFKAEVKNSKFIPSIKDNIKVFSMGFLLEQNKALMWRGSMITKTIRGFIDEVDWGDLDILIIDLPPGTGDVYISLLSLYKINGAVLVSTPHETALEELNKTIDLFRKFQVKVLGTVENMIENKEYQSNASFKADRKSMKKEGFIRLNLNFAEKLEI